jgi:hypothetical protein
VKASSEAVQHGAVLVMSAYHSPTGAVVGVATDLLARRSSTPLFDLATLPERVLADASLVVVDQIEAALEESGEIIRLGT